MAWHRIAFVYDEEIADELCHRVSEGENLKYVCKFDDVGWERKSGEFPTVGTVYSWTRPASSSYNASFTERFSEAMIVGQHAFIWETLQIADTPEYGEETTEETVENETDKGSFTRTVTRTVKKEMTAHRKLRIDARLKLIEKFNPTLWSDKLRKAEDDDNTITIIGGLF